MSKSISRREALKTMGAAAVAAGLGSVIPSSAMEPGKKKNMKVLLQVRVR